MGLNPRDPSDFEQFCQESIQVRESSTSGIFLNGPSHLLQNGAESSTEVSHGETEHIYGAK